MTASASTHDLQLVVPTASNSEFLLLLASLLLDDDNNKSVILNTQQCLLSSLPLPWYKAASVSFPVCVIIHLYSMPEAIGCAQESIWFLLLGPQARTATLKFVKYTLGPPTIIFPVQCHKFLCSNFFLSGLLISWILHCPQT